ncbi:hypothetical protein GCM10023215_65920 [Pseudonocardia yuanmonensis]|uniref:Uncharacterized protein n=1 Tax=Pseudonocardia yuanmonensis TaxID=1095914 RepID=A0ABP8XV08_9PSEU
MRFEKVSRDEAVSTLAPTMGAEAEWYVDTILAGSVTWPVQVSPAVEEITGRPATTFADWAAQNASAFRGNSRSGNSRSRGPRSRERESRSGFATHVSSSGT